MGLFGLIAFREAHLVLSTPISSWTQDPLADCGVVLTGGAGRVREGMALFEKGAIKTLVISGVNPQTELRDLMTPFDLALGVNPKDIILERRSQTTYGNAHQSIPILEALHCRDLILITSSVHMYRAHRTFAAAIPGDMRIIQHAVAAPKAEEDFFNLATEVLKSMFYSLWAYA
ncbi:MAG: YdcF family protein [Bdellovibrio sp.]|jgi:uncharacterized SAM-binding protein YcdF (DUF218 family)